jgi:glycosyltransferase involved in cell wall biosynthesis
MRKIGVFLGIKVSSGGMFQYAQSILESLSKFDRNLYQVQVVYTFDDWKYEIERFNFEAIKIKGGIYSYKWSNIVAYVPDIYGITSYIDPVYRQIIDMKCDLWVFPSQDHLSYKTKIQSLSTIHDLMHIYEPTFPEVRSFGRYWLRNYRFGSIAKKCKGVLVDSQMGKKHVKDSYMVNGDNIHVLPYIAPGYIRGDKPKDFDLKFNLPEKFLFYPAQFWEHKNHIRILQALSILTSKNSSFKVVFTGGVSGQYKNMLNTIKNLKLEDHVQILGRVPDEYLSSIYKRSSGLIMPTFFGPTNIPPLEAFACRCPVAISNIYGMPDQMNGAALLFNPLSVEEIASSMNELWNNHTLCKDLIRKGVENDKSLCIENFSLRLRNIIEGLI